MCVWEREKETLRRDYSKLFGSWCNSPWDNSLMHVYRLHTNRYRKLKKMPPEIKEKKTELMEKSWCHSELMSLASQVFNISIQYYRIMDFRDICGKKRTCFRSYISVFCKQIKIFPFPVPFNWKFDDFVLWIFESFSFLFCTFKKTN